jgi:menaquinone-dependent protoporphyrinogen oxidase
MAVLVAVASKYGATREIADAIGQMLAEQSIEAEVANVGEVGSVSSYEAVVLGSAVYVGHWLEPARTFVDEHTDELSGRPTWLFSSGPIGSPPRPAEEAVQISELVAATGARGHRVFAGKLDKSKLSFGERAVVFAFRAEEGDFRNWDEIAGWAAEIATALGSRS